MDTIHLLVFRTFNYRLEYLLWFNCTGNFEFSTYYYPDGEYIQVPILNNLGTFVF